MNEKQSNQIIAELVSIKKLLILILQSQDVKVGNIANVLGVSAGRISQLAATKKYKRRKGVTNGQSN